MMFNNERDVEIPAVLEFVRPDCSILDVGAHYSNTYYAKEVREIVKAKYTAIDLQHSPEVEAIVDEYIVGDIKNLMVGADRVMCISTLEHCGHYGVIADPDIEQLAVAKKLFQLAAKSLLITVPYGEPASVLGQFSNFDKKKVKDVSVIGANMNFKLIRSFYWKTLMLGKPWEEVSQEAADQVPYDNKKGCLCCAILEYEKL